MLPADGPASAPGQNAVQFRPVTPNQSTGGRALGKVCKTSSLRGAAFAVVAGRGDPQASDDQGFWDRHALLAVTRPTCADYSLEIGIDGGQRSDQTRSPDAEQPEIGACAALVAAVAGGQVRR